MYRKEALDFLKRLADAIADTFGKSCETVIHEISEHDLRIVYIRNGSVTGRAVGDRTSLLGDQSHIKKVYSGKDLANYKAVTRDDKLIKSTTVHCKGDNYHYGLGINFDYTMLSLIDNTVKELIQTGPEYNNVLAESIEISLDEIFAECVDTLGIPVSFMKKDDKYNIVEMLEKKSAFSIQGSVPAIAEKLGVSRYTVYNYLREIRNSGK